VVVVAGPGVADAEVEVRGGGGAGAGGADRSDPVAGGYARAGSYGQRGEVEVGGVVAVDRAHAHREAG
jgi:hypothetical protein